MKDHLLKKIDTMDIIALGLCLFAISFWSILLSYKFFHFGYYDWDLALFAQAMWGLCHGSSYVSLFDANIFSNHANLIAYVILPVYTVFQHPLTLIFLKVISYTTAAYVLYLLAKEKLSANVGILLLWLYLTYTPNVFGLLYEFDFESLAPAFLMLILYFYVKERWWGFLICAVLLILIKENLPLIILAFSIHGLFTKKDKLRWGIIPGILALISFYLLVFVFIPRMSGLPIGRPQPYYVGQDYKDLGGSVGGVLFTMILHPVKTLHYLLTPVNLSFLVAIFNPIMYLPLGAPGVLFLVSPIFLQHLLSASQTEHNIRYFYVMTMAPFLFLATIETLKYFYKNIHQGYRLTLFLLFFISLLTLTVNFDVFKKRFLMIESWNETKGMTSDRWKLVQLIPKEASVVASFSFLAQLSQRRNLYPFYKIYDFRYQNEHYHYKLPSDVQYALIDIHDPWLLIEDKYDSAKERAIKFLTTPDWKILKRYDRYILYKRKVL